VKLLLEAAAQSELPVYVVITMRSDFIGDCARFRDLPEAVTAGLYLIPRMTRAQRRAAIEGPAQVGSATISPRLVNRLLNEGGDDPDQLPSLQHALMRTWVYWVEHHEEERPIDLEDCLAIGGMADALSRHAEEAFAELPDERARAIAKRMFQSLTEKGSDNREVRRPTKVADIAAMADAQVPEVIEVIEYFRQEGRSFLTPPFETPLNSESVIDISHESLIRGWNRLRTWVEEEYESAKMYRRLAETATLCAKGNAALWQDPDLANALQWRAVEKPTAAWAKCYDPGFEAAMAFLEESRQARDRAAAEREISRRTRLRNARLFAATVTAMFLIAAATAVYALAERGRAVENARQAQKERDAAQVARNMAESNRTMAVDNQNMALGFASTTVRGLSDLSDFVLSQREVQDHFESLLGEAGTVHQTVLQHEHSNFQALVMRVNAQTAVAKLHIFSGRVDAAKKECSEQETEAAELEKTDSDGSRRLMSAYLLSRVGNTRMAFNDDHKQALADVRQAVRVADSTCSEFDRKHTVLEQQVLRCIRGVYATSGYVEDQYGDPKAALQNYRKAVNILTTQEEEANTHGKPHLDARLREFLLSDVMNLATQQTKAGQNEAAAATYANAFKLAKSWDKKDAGVIHELFWLYTASGDSKKQAQRYAEAEQDFQAAARVARDLNPNTTDAQSDSATAEDRLGTLEHYRADTEQNAARKQERLQAARKHHEMALERYQAMEKARGKNPGLETNIGIAENNLAWDLTSLQKATEARAHYQLSLAAYKLAADVTQNDEDLRAAARAYRNLALLDRQRKDWDGAIGNYRNAIDSNKKVVRLDEDVKHLLLSDFAQLADARVDKGELDAALDTYKEGMETGEHWTVAATKPTPTLVKDVIALHLGRGDVWLQKKKYEEANTEYDSAERHAGYLIPATVDAKFARSQVSERRGKAWTTQATAEGNTTRQGELLLHAKTCYDETLQLRRQILAAGENADADHNLGIAENNVAWNRYYLKDWEDARKHFTASADAYSEAQRRRPTDAEQSNLETAYVVLALLDADRGKELLSNGKDPAAQEAFKSARTAAARTWARADGRRVRSVVEEYIATFWREAGLSAKSQGQREEYLRHALEGDANALKLWGEIASGKKDADVEQHVGNSQKEVGLDYAHLKDEKNAEQYFDASSRTYLAAKPGNETIRAVASNYDELATVENNLGNHRAARHAYDKEIELLKPLLENLQATAADKERLAGAFGSRSWKNTLLGDAWAALSDADQGLALDSRRTFIRLNKADAYLLLGQADKAREIYFPAATDPDCKWCKDTIIGDLVEIQNRPELKVDPKLLAGLQDELKRTTPQLKTGSQPPGGKP
jgi:tetratricopeptide (TPR) repeat protein